MSAVTVHLGPKLFQFESHTQWVWKAPNAWKRVGVRAADTISLDAKGRPCLIGRDMATARDEDAFPVSVYLVRDDLPQYAVRADAAEQAVQS